MGDSLGAGIVYHLSKNELPPLLDGHDEDVPSVSVESPKQQNAPVNSPGMNVRKGPNGAEEAEVAAV